MSSVLRLVLIFGLCSVLAPVCSLAQDELPSPLEVRRDRQAKGGTQAATNDQAASLELFVSELENLIPGGVPEGSDLEREIRKAVEKFIEGKFNEADQLFDGIAKTERNLPPKELLFAGLWYAANEASRGQVFLEKSAVDYPDYPGVYVAFSRLAINQNRLTDALALLEKAERLIQSGTFSETESQHFQEVFLDAMVDLKMRRRQYVDAKSLVDRLQIVTPDAPKVLLTYAELEFQGGNVEKSIDYLKKLKEKSPKTRVPELILASWALRKGETEKAEQFLKQASQLYPEDLTVQLEFADFSINREEFDAAQVAIDQVEKSKGEQRVTLVMKAKIAFAKQAYGLAESHYEKLARMAPRDFDARNMFALSMAESKEESKRKLAMQIAAQNLQRLPNNPIAVAAAGWIAFKNGNAGQAETLLTRAAQARSLAPEVAYYLATVKHSQGKSQQAKLILEPALASRQFFYYRAAARELIKKIDATASQPNPGK